MKNRSLGRALRPGFLAAAALALLVLLPASASAQKPSVRDAVSTFEYTQNMHPMGYSPFANTPNLPGQTFTANSDLAFQGKYAFQGHYIGFRIIDISSSANPRESPSRTATAIRVTSSSTATSSSARGTPRLQPARPATASRYPPALRACTSSTSATCATRAGRQRGDQRARPALTPSAAAPTRSPRCRILPTTGWSSTTSPAAAA